jgi:hypothetical protein
VLLVLSKTIRPESSVAEQTILISRLCMAAPNAEQTELCRLAARGGAKALLEYEPRPLAGVSDPRRRALHLLLDGAFSTALTAVRPLPPMPENVAGALRQKFPAATGSLDFETTMNPRDASGVSTVRKALGLHTTQQFTAAVLAALRSIPPRAAPGPSGVRAEHCLELIHGPAGGKAKDALVNAVDRVLRCEVPAERCSIARSYTDPQGWWGGRAADWDG